MLKKILLGCAVVIGAFLAYVALQPSAFTIERSVVIQTSPETVFAQVNDFHHWSAWSPWAKLDPNMKTEFAGAPVGEGAIYSWAGNADVGVGSMTMLTSEPPQHIVIQLDFKEPMASTATSEFMFSPEGDKTKVTWKMTGQNNFVSRMFCVFMDMDAMVGGEFEKGLNALKGILENPA